MGMPKDYKETCEAGDHLSLVPIGPNGKKISSRVNALVVRVSPKQEQALRLYALGKYSLEEFRIALGVGAARATQIINSAAGQSVIANVRGELEHRFQSQFEEVINVLDLGLKHPEPSVALAAANLWLKHNRGTKVEVKVTAEDLVAKIMNGEV